MGNPFRPVMLYARIFGSIFLFLLSSDTLLASPKVTQAALIHSVDVRAIEEFGKAPRLDFFITGKGIAFSVEWSKAFAPHPEPSYTNPFMRFQAFNIRGLPNPLILAVAVAPGGSDSVYESYIIAPASGTFKLMTQGPLTNNDDGGIFIGHINKSFGFGLISWNFMWGDEAHSEPHRYNIQIFSWDRRCQCFRYVKAFTTDKKYPGWQAAFADLGFPRENLRDTVIRGEHSSLGFEEGQK